MNESILADKRFMSYRGKVIYYNRKTDGEIYYVIHLNGNNIYFSTYEKAMEYIDNKRGY